MQWIITIFLMVLVIIFATLYTLFCKEIKNINEQLHMINNSNTNSKIKLSWCNKHLKSLVLQINKNLEEKQKVKVEYKRMDLELRQAIANISHDLRTPLTSIMGYMQLMEDEHISDCERKQYIDVIKNRTKSLQILISEFYDLSRLQSDEYVLELKALNLCNIMCDTMAAFYYDFVNKGIEPMVQVDEKAKLIIADENAVRRIISNLIQNALKYAKEFVHISLKQEKEVIVTTITNDALYLSEEDASHLFERFFTEDRTRSGKSTGLGLAITKSLVEKMGNSISSELKENKFSITIKWKNIN